MASSFLARIPKKYLIDHEERKFWDALLNYIEEIKEQANNSAINLDNSSTVSDPYGSGGQDTPPVTTDPYSGSGGNSGPATVPRIEAVADAITFNAVNGHDVIAFNNATIILPDNPPDKALINVLQGDNNTTTVRSNSKPLQGTNAVTFSIAGSYYGFEYSSIADAWRIV